MVSELTLTGTPPEPIFNRRILTAEKGTGRASEPDYVLELAIAVLLIALNGLFSLSELAIVSARKSQWLIPGARAL
jgi:hypothetical protein